MRDPNKHVEATLRTRELIDGSYEAMIEAPAAFLGPGAGWLPMLVCFVIAVDGFFTGGATWQGAHVAVKVFWHLACYAVPGWLVVLTFLAIVSKL